LNCCKAFSVFIGKPSGLEKRAHPILPVPISLSTLTIISVARALIEEKITTRNAESPKNLFEIKYIKFLSNL
jgi:hypothetical protein